MRIAMLSYRSKPHCGGQGIYIRHLSRELVALGHRSRSSPASPTPTSTTGVALTKVPSLDLYREPDPFRVPKLARVPRPASTSRSSPPCAPAGFPEPRPSARRVARLLKERAGDFDIAHDNQVLGYRHARHRGLRAAADHHAAPPDHLRPAHRPRADPQPVAQAHPAPLVRLPADAGQGRPRRRAGS